MPLYAGNETLSMNTFRVCTTRIVTVDECPWLDADIPAGMILRLASDPYRVCSRDGVPVHIDDTNRYVEVPANAVVGIVE